MTLRKRLGLVAGITAGIAVLLAALVGYWVVRGQLRGEVDNELRAQAAAIQHDLTSLSQALTSIPPSAGGPAPYASVVLADGTTFSRQPGITLPASPHAMQVAAGNTGPYLSDVTVQGSHLRMITFQAPGVYEGQTFAVQLARPLGGVDHILSHLRLVLALVCLGGFALAGALARMASRRVLAPLAEVAGTAQHISETEDLSSRIRVHADDEVGQLARRFNAMMDRLQRSRAELDESVRAQRQLVADASHELRTPITSLRTNVEVLLESEKLSEDDRRRLLNDVVEQSEELTALIGDLIELARGDLPNAAVEDVRLDRIVEDSVARANRDFPEVRFETSLAPVIVEGIPERLGRAVNNLLDNAARHSPSGAAVEVVVDAQGVRVRDHGAGVDEADLPYLFDRFYRGASSRGSQGSGLGLAIVRQTALQHGGSVSAANDPGGGAVFAMRLPTSPAAGEQDEAVRAGADGRHAPV